MPKCVPKWARMKERSFPFRIPVLADRRGQVHFTIILPDERWMNDEPRGQNIPDYMWISDAPSQSSFKYSEVCVRFKIQTECKKINEKNGAEAGDMKHLFLWLQPDFAVMFFMGITLIAYIQPFGCLLVTIWLCNVPESNMNFLYSFCQVIWIIQLPSRQVPWMVKDAETEERFLILTSPFLTIPHWG